jgi:hypothetical protein
MLAETETSDNFEASRPMRIRHLGHFVVGVAAGIVGSALGLEGVHLLTDIALSTGDVAGTITSIAAVTGLGNTSQHSQREVAANTLPQQN